MKSKHTNCTHEKTPAARRACRKAASLRLAEATRDYLEYAGVDHALARHKAARAVLEYFARTGHLP